LRRRKMNKMRKLKKIKQLQKNIKHFVVVDDPLKDIELTPEQIEKMNKWYEEILIKRLKTKETNCKICGCELDEKGECYNCLINWSNLQSR
jgi:hypothetical protein